MPDAYHETMSRPKVLDMSGTANRPPLSRDLVGSQPVADSDTGELSNVFGEGRWYLRPRPHSHHLALSFRWGNRSSSHLMITVIHTLTQTSPRTPLSGLSRQHVRFRQVCRQVRLPASQGTRAALPGQTSEVSPGPFCQPSTSR